MKLSHHSKLMTAAIVLIASAGVAGSHAASSSNKAVAARHFQMQMVGYNIGVLGAIAKGEMEFSQDMVDGAAKTLAALAAMDHAPLWIEGTEQGAAEGSRAKPDVWTDAAGFAEKFADMEKASLALVGAADAAAVGAGMGALGGSCKACHETYRGPKN